MVMISKLTTLLLVFVASSCAEQHPTITEVDFLVVGSGAGGAAAAAAIAATGASVTVLEAGDDPSLMGDVNNLAKYVDTWSDKHIDLGYVSMPQQQLNHRRLDQPRAQVGGGCTSHNAGVWFLGDRRVFDDWANSTVDTSWSWDHVKQYYEKVLLAYKGNFTRPLLDSSESAASHWSQVLIAAGESAGYPYNAAPNDPHGDAFGTSHIELTAASHTQDVNTFFLRRASAWTQFLHPKTRPKNLTVKLNTKVLRLHFGGDDGKQIVGLVAHDATNDRFIEFRARREIILAAGVVGTPQLLLLSGIGPRTVLEKAGVAVQHELDGVGANFQDHTYVPIVSPPLLDQTTPMPSGVSPHNGVIAYPKSSAKLTSYYTAMFPCPPSSNESWSWNRSDKNALEADSEAFSFRARGRVTINSSDPFAPAVLDPAYLEGPGDMAHAVDAFHAARELLYSSTLMPLYNMSAGEVLPGDHVQTNEQIEAYIRSILVSDFHLAGTARMGRGDKDDVVDSQLRVIGLRGLRIADASVMPILPSGNMQIQTMMIGLKAADLVLAHSSDPSSSTTPHERDVNPSPPQIPQEFQAKVRAIVGSIARPSLYDTISGAPPGMLYFDGRHGRSRVDVQAELPWGPLNVTTLELASTGYEIVNSQCRTQAETAFARQTWFDWLRDPRVKYAGQSLMHGVLTDEWILSVDNNATFKRFNAIGNVPVFLYATHIVPLTENISKPINTEIHFDSIINYHTPDPALFIPTEDCLGPGLVCPKSSVENITVFTFEPAGPQFQGTLQDQDAADVLGDAAFGCADILTNGTLWDNNAYVLQYDVEVDTSWGQYSFCNYQNCLGNNAVNVGREISFALTQHAGQCNATSEFGFWLSFRRQGECSDGQPVRQNSCTWRVMSWRKMIETKCLIKQGFADACHHGFDAAAKVFAAAFAHGDEAEGGCPDVRHNAPE